jgi:hypothetical protein
MLDFHSTTLFNIQIQPNGDIRGESIYPPNYQYYTQVVTVPAAASTQTLCHRVWVTQTMCIPDWVSR